MGIDADPGVKADNSIRKRANDALKDQRLDRIYSMIVTGASDDFIAKELGLSIRNYRRYVKILQIRNVQAQLEKRQEYLAMDLAVTKERLMFDKRQVLRIITDPATIAADKLTAISKDVDINLLLMKLEYEGSLYMRMLNKNDTVAYDTIQRGLFTLPRPRITQSNTSDSPGSE